MRKAPSQLLDLAVLSLLRNGEMHGYQIRKSLAETAGPLFQFSFGSLYPALARLEERGAVASYVEAGPAFIGATGSLTGDLALSLERSVRSGSLGQGDRSVRQKRVFRITDVGKKLHAQLLETLPLESEGEFMAWLYLAQDADRSMVAERARERLLALEAKRRSRSRGAIPEAGLRAQIHRRLADLLESEIGFVKSVLGWLETGSTAENVEMH
ncbi:MAG: helix-turn-helix transcriptional regulator [Actinomycetota bacterium]|nr:helix-turn-helix transcriptional regulator [Actinomycetota bacterium]